MISRLDISEFRKRLMENTTYGNPKMSVNPFNIFRIFESFSKNKFLGDYGKLGFRLTTNRFFCTTPYFIDGTYESTNVGKTEVKYKLRPIWFAYLFIRIIPIVSIIIIFALGLSHRD
jgi:hypothetical protein